MFRIAINIAFKNDMINPKIILVLYGDTQFKILNVILNMDMHMHTKD
jgi:hypothetical protein